MLRGRALSAGCAAINCDTLRTTMTSGTTTKRRWNDMTTCGNERGELFLASCLLGRKSSTGDLFDHASFGLLLSLQATAELASIPHPSPDANDSNLRASSSSSKKRFVACKANITKNSTYLLLPRQGYSMTFYAGFVLF